MSQYSFKYDGRPLFNNPDWVGFAFKASGVGLLGKWFLRKLANLNQADKCSLIICDLLGDNENEIMSHAFKSILKPFFLDSNFDERDWRQYVHNYGEDHCITSDSRNWLLILPFDEQMDDQSYALWAGEKSVWDKFEVILQQIPEVRNPTAELHNELNTYTKSDFFFSDRPELSRNIALSLRHAKFVKE